MKEVYDVRKDPLAIDAHNAYIKVITHLPECPTCKRLNFAQLGKNVAIATGPSHVSREEAFAMFCPPAQAIITDYTEKMGRWMASRGITDYVVALGL